MMVIVPGDYGKSITIVIVAIPMVSRIAIVVKVLMVMM